MCCSPLLLALPGRWFDSIVGQFFFFLHKSKLQLIIKPKNIMPFDKQFARCQHDESLLLILFALLVIQSTSFCYLIRCKLSHIDSCAKRSSWMEDKTRAENADW
jgi:hypothetical protein